MPVYPTLGSPPDGVVPLFGGFLTSGLDFGSRVLAVPTFWGFISEDILTITVKCTRYPSQSGRILLVGILVSTNLFQIWSKLGILPNIFRLWN